MPRQSILLFLGLALVGVSQTAVAAEAKDDKQNRIYSRSTCSQSLKKARQDHSIEYPFNIKRIRTIYQRSNPKIIVNTAIIDNGFLGYTLDFNDGESRRVPGRIFKPIYFPIDEEDDFESSIELKGPPEFSADPNSPGGINDKALYYGHGTHVAGLVLGGATHQQSGTNDSESVPSISLVAFNPGTSIVNLFIVDASQDGELADRSSPNVRINDGFITQYRNRIHKYFFNYTGSSSDDMQKNIDKIDIINMSFTKEFTSTEIPDIESFKNQLIIVSAGNANRSINEDPESASDELYLINDNSSDLTVISVASIDRDDQLSFFSNYGSAIDIAAPGCAVESWIDGTEKTYALDGTSMAAPLVSFAATLLKSAWGDVSAEDLRTRLLSSARYDNRIECQGGRSADNRCVRFGRILDIESALSLNTDTIELDECFKPDNGQEICGLVHGTISAFPADRKLFPSCAHERMGTNIAGQKYIDLPFNAGVRRLPGKPQDETLSRRFSILYSKDKDVVEKQCDAEEGVYISVSGAFIVDQAGEMRLIGEMPPIDPGAVRRIVIRAKTGR